MKTRIYAAPAVKRLIRSVVLQFLFGFILKDMTVSK